MSDSEFIFETYHYDPVEETMSWKVPAELRDKAPKPVAPVIPKPIEPTPAGPQATLRYALQVIKDQLPKQNLWLETQVQLLALEVERQRRRRNERSHLN